MYPFLGSSFKTINVLILSQTSSQTPADDNMDNDFCANDWIIKAKEPQVLDDVAVSLCTYIGMIGRAEV